jgi:hypothetical protein
VLENLNSSEDDKVNEDDDFQPEPTVKIPKKNYDSCRKFQLSLVVRCPWAEAIESAGITMVKCRTCKMATWKPTILALKIATLQRHEGHYTTEKNMPGGIKKGQKYVATNCRHLKNERLVASRGVRPIDEAMQEVAGERTRKRQ